MFQNIDHLFNIIDFFNNASEFIGNDHQIEYDLIIMDLGMPKISGYDLISYLKRIKCNSKIIIISGLHREAVSMKMRLNELDLNNYIYLQKPLTRDILENIIKMTVHQMKNSNN